MRLGNTVLGVKMLFKSINKTKFKLVSLIALALIVFTGLFLFLLTSINMEAKKSQDVFAYTVKVRDTVEALDKIFERAEVNVNVMTDAIANSYDVSKQQNKSYNLHFTDGINGLIKSVLSNSPCVDGSWFQLNAALPFSARAYNWFEVQDDQFIDVKNQFVGTPSMDRQITPEDDPYYFDALADEKPVWSDIYTDADTKKAMITISSPVYNNNTLVGVVGLDISIDSLQQVLNGMQLVLGKSDLYLLNKDNKVILSQLYSETNALKDNPNYLEKFDANSEGPIEYSDGLIKKTAIKLTLSNDYQIVIAIYNEELFAGANRLISIIYALFVLLILSTTFAFADYFKRNKITLSTEAVSKAVDKDAVEGNDN